MSAPDREIEALLPLLLRLVDLPVDHAAVRAAATAVPPPLPEASPETSLAHVGEVARRVGLSCVPITLSTRDATLASGPAAPMVGLGRGESGELEWVVVTGYRGWRARMATVTRSGERRHMVSLAALGRRLGSDPDRPRAWLSVQAMAPLAMAATPPGDPHHLTPFRRLLRMLQPERRDLAYVVVFSVGVGLLGLATPVAVQGLVNAFALGGLVQPLVVLSILLFLFLALGGAFRVLQTYVLEIVQRRIFVRVLADLAHRLPRLRVEVLERSHGPELVNRFFDVLTVQKASATLFLESVANVLQTVIGLLVLAFYHPILLVFGLLLFGAMAVVVFGFGRRGEKTAIEESIAKYAAAAWLQEVARNPNAFKLSGGYALALERADLRAADYLAARRGHFRVVLRQVVGALGLQAVAGTTLLALGGGLVIAGELTLGQLVAAELIVSIVLATFAKVGKDLESFYDLLAAVDKLGHLVDLPLERYGGDDLPPPPAPRGLAVEIRDVSFRYPAGPAVLSGFSLSLRPGERVLVAGRVGTGKSTLAELLYGSRDLATGTVTLDGVDLRDLRLESVRRWIALATEGEIITDTIVANVRFGHDYVSHDDVRRALEAVGLQDEIAELPDGADTLLGADGTPLSYGQSRRLVLARALAMRPRLLIVDGLLDELAPDARERACAALLDDAARSRTLLVLTSYPERIPGFDRVVQLPERA